MFVFSRVLNILGTKIKNGINVHPTYATTIAQTMLVKPNFSTSVIFKKIDINAVQIEVITCDLTTFAPLSKTENVVPIASTIFQTPIPTSS